MESRQRRSKSEALEAIRKCFAHDDEEDDGSSSAAAVPGGKRKRNNEREKPPVNTRYATTYTYTYAFDTTQLPMQPSGHDDDEF